MQDTEYRRLMGDDVSKHDVVIRLIQCEASLSLFGRNSVYWDQFDPLFLPEIEGNKEPKK